MQKRKMVSKGKSKGRSVKTVAKRKLGLVKSKSSDGSRSKSTPAQARSRRAKPRNATAHSRTSTRKPSRRGNESTIARITSQIGSILPKAA